MAAWGQTRAAIQKQYDKYAKAYVSNDVKTMLAILSPKYTLKDDEGKVLSFKDYKAQLLARQKAGRKSSAYVVRIDSLRIRGGQAIVMTSEISQEGATKNVHRYRDVWRKIGKVWKLETTSTLGPRT